jgi:predicted nucleic acid-binding protein
LRTPDAMQIALAKTATCQAFLTNSKALERVTDVKVLVLDELTFHP